MLVSTSSRHGRRRDFLGPRVSGDSPTIHKISRIQKRTSKPSDKAFLCWVGSSRPPETLASPWFSVLTCSGWKLSRSAVPSTVRVRSTNLSFLLKPPGKPSGSPGLLSGVSPLHKHSPGAGTCPSPPQGAAASLLTVPSCAQPCPGSRLQFCFQAALLSPPRPPGSPT